MSAVAVEVVRDGRKRNEVRRVDNASIEGGLKVRDAGVKDGDLHLRLVLLPFEFLLDLVHAHVLDAPGHVLRCVLQLLDLYGLRELDLEDGVQNDVGSTVSLFQGLIGDFSGLLRAVLQEVPAVEVDDVCGSLNETFSQCGTGADHDAAGLVEVV